MPTDRDLENNKHDPNHDSSQMPQNRDWDRDNESNPFVAFRRFADEQVSSVLQSITGLPSTVAPPQPDHWTIFTDDQGYKNMAYRQRDGATNTEERKYTPAQGTTESSSGDQDNTPPNNHDKAHTHGDAEKSISRPRQSQPPNDDLWPTRNGRNKPSDFFSLDSLFDRLEDRFLPFSPRLFHPHLRFSFPDMFEDSSSPTWPLTYIMFSPYSPLHLERQAQLRARNERGVFSSLMSSLSLESETDPDEPQWREAFEDLLRIENGKPMIDRTSLSTRTPENGTEWLQSFVKRGSLGDRWKYVYGSKDQPWSGITFSGSYGEDQTSFDAGTVDHNRDTNANRANEGAKSELDLYERASNEFETQRREIAEGLREREMLLNQHQRDTPQAEGEYQQGNEDTETWLDLVSGGNRKSVPETPESATESTSSRVISTISRTERVRLADGSIQTKKFQTRRYADGREETDSSVETSHTSSEDVHPTEPGEKPKGGWFWND